MPVCVFLRLAITTLERVALTKAHVRHWSSRWQMADRARFGGDVACDFDTVLLHVSSVSFFKLKFFDKTLLVACQLLFFLRYDFRFADFVARSIERFLRNRLPIF